jgi:hypothetical protein
MQTNCLRWQGVDRCGPPYLDGDIRRGRYKSLVVLGKDNVIDPVGVGLDLAAELRGRRLVGGGIRVGKRVALVVVVVVVRQVEVEVPGAYDAVATARVAGMSRSVSNQPRRYGCELSGYAQD